MGFLDLLSGGLTAATNAAGAYQGAKAQGARQSAQDQMTLYGLVRQQQEDADARRLHDSQIQENEARAKSYGQTRGTWKMGADGNMFWAPTTSLDGDAPQLVGTDQKGYVPPKTITLDNKANPSSLTKDVYELSPGDDPEKLGTRTEQPRSSGSSRAGSSPESIELSRAVSAVKAQIAEVDKDISNANATIKAGTADFAPYEAMQKAQLAKAALKAAKIRRDSLQTVHDSLARRQQNKYVAEPGEPTPALKPNTLTPITSAPAAPTGPAAQAAPTTAPKGGVSIDDQIRAMIDKGMTDAQIKAALKGAMP